MGITCHSEELTVQIQFIGKTEWPMLVIRWFKLFADVPGALVRA